MNAKIKLRKFTLFILVIYFILFNFSNADLPNLKIERSMSHEDKSGPYTPLEVCLSSQNVENKTKSVDLICVVDISGSMDGDKLELAKKSLVYMANQMKETDNFALVTFSYDSQLIYDLTEMTEQNKTLIKKKINNLKTIGTTNIFAGLEKALELIKGNYSSGERVASIILLSDGYDNMNPSRVDNMFRELLKNENKSNYTFTTYCFGYGEDFDWELLRDIALTKDGNYFSIQFLTDVKKGFMTIYGGLSTVMDVNIELKIQSEFNIIKVYGKEDMHEAYIINDTLSTFIVKIIQVIYGKEYKFVLLVDIPKNTPKGTEVLNATVTKLGLKDNYLWDGKFSPHAYEEYIRCIVVEILIEGYQYGKSNISAIETGIIWIKKNYNGTRNWVKELIIVKEELRTGSNIGKANLLSKITELKTSKIGIHYDEGNSYQRQLIVNSYSLNIENMTKLEIKGEKILNFTENMNYYYFYLKGGYGQINNMPFSGDSSSLIIYSNDTSSNIKIKSFSDSMECYYYNKSIKRIQMNVDFNHIGKFIINKNFPFDFYTRVDGKRDITFNIEFLKFDYNLTDKINISELLTIKAYILHDNEIENLGNNNNILQSKTSIFEGTFNNKLNLGKIVIKQNDIYNNMNSIYNNHFYVVIEKNINFNINNNIEGQFFFIPNNYIYSSIAKNYKIYSHLLQNEKEPHLYTLEIDRSSNDNLYLIEIEILEDDELDYKIINYQNYIDNIIDLYNDYNGYMIERCNDSNKLYINVTQKHTNDKIDKIILSIFSKNKDHIPNNNISYIFKYTTEYREIHNAFSSDLISDSTLTSESNIIIKTIQTQKPIYKIKAIILGFAKYTYDKINKIINFFIYFV